MITPYRFLFLKKVFADKSFNLLDIGSGNGSASLTKKLFPKCRYYGLDITRDYGYKEEDFALMEDFYLLDLTVLNYSIIPDSSGLYLK